MLNIMQHIGAKIRLYRLAKHLTQEQLADCIGSTGTYIGRLERGEKMYESKRLLKSLKHLISAYLRYSKTIMKSIFTRKSGSGIA